MSSCRATNAKARTIRAALAAANARKWFELFRRPAMDKARSPNAALLFATHEGKRWRVMGCSRLGDVWLNVPDHVSDYGYAKRVDVDTCSEWNARAEADR